MGIECFCECALLTTLNGSEVVNEGLLLQLLQFFDTLHNAKHLLGSVRGLLRNIVNGWQQESYTQKIATNFHPKGVCQVSWAFTKIRIMVIFTDSNVILNRLFNTPQLEKNASTYFWITVPAIKLQHCTFLSLLPNAPKHLFRNAHCFPSTSPNLSFLKVTHQTSILLYHTCQHWPIGHLLLHDNKSFPSFNVLRSFFLQAFCFLSESNCLFKIHLLKEVVN